MADEAAEKIISKIRKEFRHNRLALFDEMNVLGIKKHVSKLYKDVFKAVKKEFLSILNPLYQEIYDEALALGFDGDLRDLDEGWIEEFFDEYNPVTKYVFKNELGRKEARLFEDLVAMSNTPGTNIAQSYKTAENLLLKQVKQCAINLEDAIALTVYKAVGVERVRWVAEIDHRTCDVCAELDGQIFDLKEAPSKQHYQCRCYLIPVKE